MKKFIILSLISLSAFAQTKATRFYQEGDRYVHIDSTNNQIYYYPVSQVTLRAGLVDDRITMVYNNNYTYFLPTKFLNKSGVAYSALSSQAALTAFFANTDTVNRVTNGGAVTAGASYISITNVGSAAGIVTGQSLAAGGTITFPVIAGKAHPAIFYDATGTTFLIVTSR